MTDNEIVKALECCMGCGCKECPNFNENDIDEECCMGRLIIEALKLVNRQKAEIKRLTVLAELGNMRANDYRAMRDKTKNVRAEAVKEFEERLKTYPIDCNLPLLGLETKQEIEAYFNSVMKQIDNAIDNLVKEMTEETKHE